MEDKCANTLALNSHLDKQDVRELNESLIRRSNQGLLLDAVESVRAYKNSIDADCGILGLSNDFWMDTLREDLEL